MSKAKRKLRKAKRAEKRKARGGSRLKVLVKKAGQAAKSVGQAAVFAPAIPFKNAMRRAIEKRGKKAPKKMSDLIRSFYDNVVKKSNFEGEDLEHVDPVTIGAIVGAVVRFFKNMRDKKKSGEKLNDEQNDFADTVEEVAKTAQEIIEEGGDEGDDDEQTSGGKNTPKAKINLPLVGAVGQNSLLLILAAIGGIYYFKKNGN